MISIRFKHIFRERMPEWVTSFALILWGLITFSQSDALWGRDTFQVLAHIANQHTWGFITILIGTARVVALIINGAWRPSGHIRAIGAFSGVIFWCALLISYLSVDWHPPAVALQLAMIILDMFAVWFASADAKMADISAVRRYQSLKTAKA